MSPEVLGVVATLGGTVIGALPGLISSSINRKSEERKQFRELVIKAAIESWKTRVQHQSTVAILPLEHYIIHTAKMCELALSEKSITPEQMKHHLQEIENLMTILVEHAGYTKMPTSNP